MTVSRTLAGGKNVRPEVQARVLEAVQQLDYHRNENARSLRGHASGLIGVAITNLSNPYYGNFALGVEEIAAMHGRRIMLGNTGEDLSRERQLVSDFVGRQVEGLILVPSGGDASHLSREQLRDIPLVLASRSADGLDADTVLLDDIGGAYRGTKVLLDRGHRRIGYLGNAASVFTGKRRFEGFERALVEFGLAPDVELIKRSQQDVESARDAMGTPPFSAPTTATPSGHSRRSVRVSRRG
jgi:LacI family transcriptional regulator